MYQIKNVYTKPVNIHLNIFNVYILVCNTGWDKLSSDF